MMEVVLAVLLFVLPGRARSVPKRAAALIPTGCFLLKPLLAGRPLIEITVIVACAALLFEELQDSVTPLWLSSKRRLF